MAHFGILEFFLILTVHLKSSKEREGKKFLRIKKILRVHDLLWVKIFSKV